MNEPEREERPKAEVGWEEGRQDEDGYGLLPLRDNGWDG